MDIQPSSRVQQIEASPTLVLVAKAKQLAAEGKDVISLSVGEPDWPTIEVAKNAGIKAIQDNFTNYTPARGIADLRKAIVEQTNNDYQTKYDIDNVAVATGGKYVLYSLFYSLINDGDEVLVPEPFWVSYPAIISICGGVTKALKTSPENQFKITANDLEKSITSKTRVLLLNSPSNPTGYLYSQMELNEIATVVKKFPKLIVVSDDIYNRLSFDYKVAPHLLNSNEDISKQLFIVNGVSKSYSMTGWRIGWALGNKSVIKAMGSFQSQTTSSTCSISQKAAVAAIKCNPDEIMKIKSMLQKRRDFALSEINKNPNLSCDTPDGAFYLWINVEKTFGKKYKDKLVHGSEEFAKFLLTDFHVVVVPGRPFNGEGFVRVSYAISQARMTEAISRINEFTSMIK